MLVALIFISIRNARFICRAPFLVEHPPVAKWRQMRKTVSMPVNTT